MTVRLKPTNLAEQEALLFFRLRWCSNRHEHFYPKSGKQLLDLL